MDQDFVFAVSHPEFYETLTRFPTTPDYEARICELVPEDWRTGRSGPWLHVNAPVVRVPAQGFKIHVSSTPSHALDVLSAIVPELVQRSISFKIAADPGLLRLLNSKGYDRGGGGKFVTIYPPDETVFVELIEALHGATSGKGFEGPYILSDRRFRDSRILFYRYGGFRPIEKLSVDGTKHHLLVAPDGSTFRDARMPYYQNPPWVRDPFPEEVEAPLALLGGRFEVQSVITASNRGGIYSARDAQTEEIVVLKEVRPHVNRMTFDGISLDGLDFLRHEFEVLTLLEPFGFAPRPVALFQEWEHLFLAEEKIEGMGLKRFMAQHENLVLSFMHVPGLLCGWLPRFRYLAEQLVRAVETIHSLGMVVGDLSVNNVIVEPDTLRIRLIDLESAVSVAKDPDFAKLSYFWYTPGFGRQERVRMESPTLAPADDHFALAMLLMSMWVGGVQFTSLQENGCRRLLDRLMSRGIPVEVRHAVEALLAGDPSAALSALENLPSA